MYKDTPNQEEVDWIVERMREIYDYEQLKDCDIDYLYNQEFDAVADLNTFKSTFPHEDSVFQGDMGEFLFSDENANREALTEEEKIRLALLRKEIEVEIHRAYGHRKEVKREHRNRIVNSIGDLLGKLSEVTTNVFSL